MRVYFLLFFIFSLLINLTAFSKENKQGSRTKVWLFSPKINNKTHNYICKDRETAFKVDKWTEISKWDFCEFKNCKYRTLSKKIYIKCLNKCKIIPTKINNLYFTCLSEIELGKSDL